MVKVKTIGEFKAVTKRLKYQQKEWYSVRASLGVEWAWFKVLLGGREAGKSYSVTDYFVGAWKKWHTPYELKSMILYRMIPFSGKYSGVPISVLPAAAVLMRVLHLLVIFLTMSTVC